MHIRKTIVTILGAALLVTALGAPVAAGGVNTIPADCDRNSGSYDANNIGWIKLFRGNGFSGGYEGVCLKGATDTTRTDNHDRTDSGISGIYQVSYRWPDSMEQDVQSFSIKLFKDSSTNHSDCEVNVKIFDGYNGNKVNWSSPVAKTITSQPSADQQTTQEINVNKDNKNRSGTYRVRCN